MPSPTTALPNSKLMVEVWWLGATTRGPWAVQNDPDSSRPPGPAKGSHRQRPPAQGRSGHPPWVGGRVPLSGVGGVPLSGLATSSASTRSRENTPVLLSYAPTRSLACPAAPRHTKGTPPGGPPAKRQGDCTPARRGQFGARLGTWARLAPCGPGQCRPRLGAVRQHGEGRRDRKSVV